MRLLPLRPPRWYRRLWCWLHGGHLWEVGGHLRQCTRCRRWELTCEPTFRIVEEFTYRDDWGHPR